MEARRLFAEVCFDIGEDFFAEAVEGLAGASCGYVHAADFRVAQQIFSSECPCRVAVEEIVSAVEPFEHRGFVPGRRESCIEKYLSVA